MESVSSMAGGEVGTSAQLEQIRGQVVEHLMRAGASVGSVADAAEAEPEQWRAALARAAAGLPPHLVPAHSPVAAVFSDHVVSEQWRSLVPPVPGCMYNEYVDLLSLAGQDRREDLWTQYCELVEMFP